MKIVIPMAGMGKRMRPHTLTIPKPLIKVAGKPIVQRLVEELAEVMDEKIDEVGFITGRFGKDVEKQLLQIAKNIGAKGKIYYQDVPLGTGHAIFCAEEMLNGKVVIAFADTLFNSTITVKSNEQGLIWIKKVDDPSQFGVVLTDKNGIVKEFVEKPKQKISDKAIIGIYYFKEADKLHSELKYLISNKITVKGEYQLTDALENLKLKGMKIKTVEVDEWLDCGNVAATIYANTRILDLKKSTKKAVKNKGLKNSIIIEPCYIENNVLIENSVVGPYVSINEGSSIKHSIVSNSIIYDGVLLENVNITESMIGSEASYLKTKEKIDISQNSKLKS